MTGPVPSWAGCPRCGGVLPFDTDDPARVCRCGSDDVHGAAWWSAMFDQLMTRAGGCEARTADCLAGPGEWLAGPRDRVSIHHRWPRGMGGTRRVDVDSPANLLLACGSGVTGCHGWIESHRDEAYRRGLLVHAGTDPATVPITLWSGRWVSLGHDSPWYLPPTSGPAYAVA